MISQSFSLGPVWFFPWLIPQRQADKQSAAQTMHGLLAKYCKKKWEK